MGPGVLDAAFPEYHKFVFNPGVVKMIGGIAMWGVMLLVMLAGKGLIEIVFANILLDKAIISSATFTALLLMAVFSMMLTIPVVYPKLHRKQHQGLVAQASS